MFRSRLFSSYIHRRSPAAGIIWAVVAIGGPLMAYYVAWPFAALVIIGWGGTVWAICVGVYDGASDTWTRFRRWYYRRKIVVQVAIEREQRSGKNTLSLISGGQVVFDEAVAEWLATNATGRYGIIPPVRFYGPQEIWFTNERDAMMFKMKWM